MEISDLITAILAGLTFVAILVALGIGVKSIRETRNLQKREFRHRLLNEIIDWAIDIRKNNPNLTSLLTTTSERLTKTTGPREEDDLIVSRSFIGKEKLELSTNHIYLSRLVAPLEEIGVRNGYMRKIASIFKNDLHRAVDTLTNELTKHIDLLQKCLDFLDRSASNEEIALAIRLANEHSDALDKSTIKVLNEATEIKTKNIG